MRLCDIPPVLKYNSTSYELRGVISYQLGGKKWRRKRQENYYAYGFRGKRNWQLFDDINGKLITIDENTEVVVELLVYTI